MIQRYKIWRVCCGSACALILIAMSPLVLDTEGKRLCGVPHTLLAGAIIALLFILLTLIASQMYPDRPENWDENE